MLLYQGGFLFSVVSPLDSVISLGLSVTAGSSLGKQVDEAENLPSQYMGLKQSFWNENAEGKP